MLSRSVHRTLKHSSTFRNFRCSSTATLNECLKNIEEHNSKINAFISLNGREDLERRAADSDNRLKNGRSKSNVDGTTIAVKDNFCTSFLPTTCASNMLKDFTSPYDATVVKLLNDAGALIIGKTNMDEFGMGSANVHSAFGAVVNPYQSDVSNGSEKRSAGGSSGGSAASVAMKMCTAALGSDTGGSVRMPASYCGVVGFKPSYGRCSRYGLISYANSLDTVGIFAREVKECTNVYDIISKYDNLDPTSMPVQLRNELDRNDTQLLLKYDNDLNGLIVGVPQEFFVDSLSTEVLEVWRNGIKHLENLGAKIVSVSTPHISLALPAYYIIALAEASSNLSRFDGVKYGHRSPDNVDQLLYVDTRTTGFGEEVKRRILLGTHVLTAGTYEDLFLPAQSARRLIQNDFDSVFKQANLLYNTQHDESDNAAAEKVDVLLVPSATSDAPTLSSLDKNGGGVEEYINDVMTLPANLAGIPAITVPFGSPKKGNGFPIGLQLLGQYGYDKTLLRIAEIMMK